MSRSKFRPADYRMLVIAFCAAAFYICGCDSLGGSNSTASIPVVAPSKNLATPTVPGLQSTSGTKADKPSKGVVEVVFDDATQGWKLLRDGKPYYVRGAGGLGDLTALATAGANSNRIWGVDETTPARLDEAEKNGISVAVGIWLEHERHGFDYSNYEQVIEQIDLTMKHVRAVKNHPALLVWGIGNEMEGEGSNPAIWAHIEHLAQLVKQEDPYHPVMTVIAEIGGKKIEAIHKLCPSVDIIGINSYGGAKSLPERYRRLGGKKPYLVTEFGPIGTWEVGKNSIETINEPTSSIKAKSYRVNAEAFAKDTQYCLGSYAFLWGNKQEGTATWFGMLLPDGKRTAAVDEMSEFWTGEPRKNLCPVIKQLKLETDPLLTDQCEVKVSLDASDPDNDPISVRWVVTGEADSYITGGDKQTAPAEIKNAQINGDENGATIKLPDEPGVYRIYAYVDDGPNNGAATANVSVRIKDAAKPVDDPGSKVDLPLVFMDEGETNAEADGTPFYVPSGFMGSTEALTVDPESTVKPKFGKQCARVEYSNAGDWGGVVWQNPENDWGEKPGGFDLTGAKKLTFWARGEKGGEEVKFGFGVIGRDKPFFDTAEKEMPITLTDAWKQYSIDLSGEDLQRIKSGFFFSLAGQGSPVVFFLDRIAYE